MNLNGFLIYFITSPPPQPQFSSSFFFFFFGRGAGAEGGYCQVVQFIMPVGVVGGAPGRRTVSLEFDFTLVRSVEVIRSFREQRTQR